MILVFIVVNFFILSIVGFFHLYWGFGGMWPGRDEPSLAKAVVGRNGITEMPSKALTLFISACLFLASIWPLIWIGLIETPLPYAIREIGMIGLIVVFIARGIAGYMPNFRRKFSELPFANYDRQYYSPLCFMIGMFSAAFFFL